MFGPPLRPRAIPFDQESLLRASGLAPTDAVAYGRLRRRHRLTVHANQLAQPAREASVAIGEPDPLRANPAGPTLDAALRVDQRHPVLGPGQVVPGPYPVISHAPGSSSTAGAFVAADASPFNPYAHARIQCVPLPLDPLDPKTLQTQNPSTLARRSHVSSLLCGNTERTPSGFPMASGVALSLVIETFRPPSKPPAQQRSAQAVRYHLRSLHSNRRRAPKTRSSPLRARAAGANRCVNAVSRVTLSRIGVRCHPFLQEPSWSRSP